MINKEHIKSIIVGIISTESFGMSFENYNVLNQEQAKKAVKTADEIMEFLKRIELVK
jgi:HEPN domain-containing protein